MGDKKSKCSHLQYHALVPSSNGENATSDLSHADDTGNFQKQDEYSSSTKSNGANVNDVFPTKSSSHCENHSPIQYDDHTNPAYSSNRPGDTGNLQEQDKSSNSIRSNDANMNNISPTKSYSLHEDYSPERSNNHMDTEYNLNHSNHTNRFKQEDVYSSSNDTNTNVASTKKSCSVDQDYSPHDSSSRMNETDNSKNDMYDLTMSEFDDNKKKKKKKQIRGVCGLTNLGNTCYMNSALQCLSNMPNLRHFFLNEDLTEGKLAQSYGRLMKAMWSGQYSSVEPSEVKKCTSDYSSVFRGYGQADAREFINVLLNSLHDELKNKDDKSIVNELFTIIIKSRLICNTCFHEEFSTEPMKFLALRPNVQNGRRMTLDNLLTLFRELKTLNGDLECNNCHELTQHFMDSTIGYPLPPIIIVHFTRFNRMRVKDENPVEFPMNYKFDDLDESNESWYELIGIVSHVGSIYSGHYTAYAKNSLTQRWYYFNDSSVRPIDDPVNESSIKRNAYMLVYAKKNKH